MNPTQIAVLLCLSSSAYAQNYYPYNNWGGRIAGIVIGSLIALFFLTLCCISLRRRRSSRMIVTQPNVPGLNTQPSQPYSLPLWQGSQMYAPPPGPPPGHPSHIATSNPYEYNAYPGSQSAPPPYMKEGEGVSKPQGTNYSSPPGPPPAAHTRENNHFV
ncbi:hypothetical protein DEU56DRAFT_794796 [Suillus clintonianus]|uniref:uncharacterized protein n=1 Tax=Suillus clintonianus TaxID=1904413 RepID=UPI001B866529|nr:uncharacterized protein DEU56DRAFT_794796 [Suillus clintonianus]KAG2141819.1 hypothetical protein DEU56DRAFT_794796 [Suillus clintonianus]